MSKKRNKVNKNLKQDRQISRDKRNTIRRKIKENVTLHRDNKVFHILFISKETENMEKILFNMSPLERGYLINLPIITLEMLDEYKELNSKELILHYFGIESDNIEQIEGTNLVVVKDFKVINNIKNLTEIMVRPYNEYSWYHNNCITTLYGERIYKDEQLKDYFVIGRNVENIFVYQDTITEVLIYRMIANKINGNAFLNRYMGFLFPKIGFESGDRKKCSNQVSFLSLYNLMIDDEKLQKILANEKNEIDELLSTDKPLQLALKPKKE